MNIREDIQQLKTSERDLRKFGLLVGGVFAVLGLLFLIRHKAHYPYFLMPGVVLTVSGAIFPRALRTIYIAWMAVAVVLGFVMAHIILTLFFFLVITPIGLVARLFGKDFLGLKLDRQGATYWIRRGQKSKAQANYERQF
ncbi:MAG TPA: SxtJ family membrane protein [Verrucomicrobiae bacterium]|nr:SxtJ family membrane protein [Verrucomicrobiae bacterium]